MDRRAAALHHHQRGRMEVPNPTTRRRSVHHAASLAAESYRDPSPARGRHGPDCHYRKAAVRCGGLLRAVRAAAVGLLLSAGSVFL